MTEEQGTTSGLPTRRKGAYALVTLLVVLGIPECGLRVAGVHFAPAGRYMAFLTRELFQFQWYLPDPEVFWKLRPSAAIPSGACYPSTDDPELYRGAYRTNSDGFRDDEFDASRAPREIRIVCLGDSCTFGVGVPREATYVRQLGDMLNKRHPQRHFRTFNLGVTGYSSLQGLRVLRRTGLALSPQLVVAYFGWNDHFPCVYYTDSEQKLDPPWKVHLQAALRASRLYQALERFLLDLKYECKEQERPRVPLGEFEENLREIVRLARANGAEALLVTAAPLRSDELHSRYVSVVRVVAKNTGALLADVEADLSARPLEERERFFIKGDSVHPNAAGQALIARLICAAIEQRALVSQWERR